MGWLLKRMGPLHRVLSLCIAVSGTKHIQAHPPAPVGAKRRGKHAHSVESILNLACSLDI